MQGRNFRNLTKLLFRLTISPPCVGEILISNFILISHIFAPLSLRDIIKHSRTAHISPYISKCVELGALWKKIYCFVLEQSVLVSKAKATFETCKICKIAFLVQSRVTGRKQWKKWKQCKTRSSWLNCALQDYEAVYWVSIGHHEAKQLVIDDTGSVKGI